MKSGTITKKAASNKPAAGSTAKSGTSRKQSAGSGRNTASRQSASSSNGSPKARQKTASSGEEATTKTKQTPFEKLFIDLLKDVYWAEQHLVESLPAMIKATTTTILKNAFEDHLSITEQHVERLEKVFNLLGQPAEAVKCDAMAALVKEAEKVIEETPDNTMTRDAGLIISAQKIEHYEIASYGSLVQVALTLEHYKAADILEMTLMEEEDTDRELTMIAESEINPIADVEDTDVQSEDMEEEEE